MARLASDDPLIIDKMIELCRLIVERPGFLSVKTTVREFFDNDISRERYMTLSRMGQQLAEKQSEGIELGEEELAEYEQAKSALEDMPGTAGFFDAQHQLHRLESTLHAYITRTLQLGRVPEPEDFSCGQCGSGCGCHDHEHDHDHDHDQAEGGHVAEASAEGAGCCRTPAHAKG